MARGKTIDLIYISERSLCMGLFNWGKKIDFAHIVSVVILEETQLYQNKSNFGLSFGSEFGDGRVIAMNNSVPNGSLVKFSITYEDGKKDVVEVRSNTETYDKLLQLAIDPPNYQMPTLDKKQDEEYVPVSLGKNEIPCGKYIIGEHIPVGTYDFSWVWGQGSIFKFDNNHNTTLGATNYFQHIGNKETYEVKQCINVKCMKGELLEISGNVIVKIAHSKGLNLDL